jgi:hypothetical protein
MLAYVRDSSVYIDIPSPDSVQQSCSDSPSLKPAPTDSDLTHDSSYWVSVHKGASRPVRYCSLSITAAYASVTVVGSAVGPSKYPDSKPTYIHMPSSFTI